ncbi:unnamed protein product [Gordionus sp. m RMFG-2023]
MINQISTSIYNTTKRYSDPHILYELEGVQVDIIPKQNVISLKRYQDILNMPIRKLDDKLFAYNFETESQVLQN